MITALPTQASKQGLRLILPLMGYWNDYGGLKQLQQLCLDDEAYTSNWDPRNGECPRFYESEVSE